MSVRKIKMKIAYDGADYHGWQIQPGFKTIQEEVNRALTDLLRTEVHVTAASRTDAGVHALGQVGVIKLDSRIPTENLARAVTDRLPLDIAVIKAEEVPQDFNVMGEVKSKLYRYTIYTSTVRPVLDIRHCWHLPAKLDVEKMAKAARLLEGKKDFKSFASAADKRKSSVRTIFQCRVNQQEDWVYIDVCGDGFLYHMVRNIVGTLAEIGRGKRDPEEIPDIIAVRDRQAAGSKAPPFGLCLVWVKY